MAKNTGVVENRQRDIMVCAQNSCKQCGNRVTQYVPDCCPYDIMHVLLGDNRGVQECARRSGKTTSMTLKANALAKAGIPVMMITRNHSMLQQMAHNGLNPHVHRGYYTIETSYCGWHPCWVFCDELGPRQVDEVMSRLPGSLLVDALYTCDGFQ